MTIPEYNKTKDLKHLFPEIKELYEKNYSCIEIARMYKTSRFIVRRLFIANGVKLRPRGRQSKVNKYAAEIKEKYRHSQLTDEPIGETLEYLSVTFNLHPMTIRKFLKAEGLI